MEDSWTAMSHLRETLGGDSNPHRELADVSTARPRSLQMHRGLAERGMLGGAIFGCTTRSFMDCIANELFCMSHVHWTYVKHLEPGMPIFLFNYFTRNLYGVFEAVSYSELNFTSTALMQEGSSTLGYTKYPAQIRVQLRNEFPDAVFLPEIVFNEILVDNYWSTKHLSFELDRDQTGKLINAFTSKARSAFGSTLSSPETSLNVSPKVHISNRTSSSLNHSTWKSDVKTEGLFNLDNSKGSTPRVNVSPLAALSLNYACPYLFPTDEDGNNFYYSGGDGDLHVDYKHLQEDESYANAVSIIASILKMVDNDPQI